MSSTPEREKQSMELASLMLEFKENNDPELRNQLVLGYSYIAKSVAVQMRGIFQNYAQMEDVVNEGILTLMDCIAKFDPGKGIKFESYAFMRVRGAVIDFVRRQDWLPRRVRVNAKSIAAAHDLLCNELMREPTQQELADRLDMPLDTLSHHYSEISNSVMLSFEGLIQNVNQMGDILENSIDENAVPETTVFQSELRAALKDAIDSLSERERLVISLYFFEHLKLSEIAGILEVSEQRVSQINTRAVLKLRQKLEAYVKG